MRTAIFITLLMMPCLATAQEADPQFGLAAWTDAQVDTTRYLRRVEPGPRIPQESPTLMRLHTVHLPKVQPLHYGFFCKVESHIASKSVLAPKFRLGSVEYVDRLEGKDRYPKRPRKDSVDE